MTLNPVRVHKDKLAVEVLNLWKAIALTIWLLLMINNAPVGIVDSQDLTRLLNSYDEGRRAVGAQAMGHGGACRSRLICSHKPA